jgi:putative flippase GtrA
MSKLIQYARRAAPGILKFGLAGLPAFAVAVPANYVLVKWLGVSKPWAYAAVLVMQVSVNYFFCRKFVFESNPSAGFWRSFVLFFNGILFFRALDWGLYWVLAEKMGLPFIGVQLFNVGLFSLLKYEYSRRVFERGARRAGADTSVS